MSNSSIILLYILIPYFLKVNAAEMRLNNQEQLVGSRCLLVPYCEKHVPKYHDWMSDPELLKATASEPLTLEQEFEMQKTWREDPDKLTFIVLDKRTWEATGDEIASMAGDINAFACPNFGSTSRCFEISVMVAEPNFRRRGIAREACQLLILYVGQRIGQSDFVAKIEANNQPSIALFRKKLNFKWDSFSHTFQLITLKLTAENIGDAVEEMDLRIQSYCE